MLRPLSERKSLQGCRVGHAPLFPHAYVEGLVTPGVCSVCKQGPH